MSRLYLLYKTCDSTIYRAVMSKNRLWHLAKRDLKQNDGSICDKDIIIVTLRMASIDVFSDTFFNNEIQGIVNIFLLI